MYVLELWTKLQQGVISSNKLNHVAVSLGEEDPVSGGSL